MDAFFDIYSGISGNMVLGALVDLGLDPVALGEKLAALGLEGEFELEVNGVNRSGITGTHVQVVLSDSEGQHAHRHFSEIKDIIESSALPPMVKKKAVDIFRNLALAEASVHGVEMEEIHFHEVGAVDAIVDIVGAAICINLLDVDKIICSPVHVGGGMVRCQHGIIPVPAPATLELLKGIPVYS
ncbi:MAG: LarC family nickel insertion protein, partial [Halanaerobiales bacterium]